MNFDLFCQRAIDEARKIGCEAEVCIMDGESTSVRVRDGEVISYSASTGAGVGVRAVFGTKVGYAATEVIDNPEVLVRRAAANARLTEREDDNPMQPGGETYRTAPPQHLPLCALDNAEKIALAKRLETLVREDKRIGRVMASGVATGMSRMVLRNTLGLDVEKVFSSNYAYVSPITAGDEEIDGFAFRGGKDAENLELIAKEAIEDAVSKLGAKPVPAGNYPIILSGEAASDLLESFWSIFSAEEAQDGLSLLAGREGEVIASECVTLVDDPFMEESFSAFDDEGVSSLKKTLIDKGKFITMLHDLKTAKKAGGAVAGNAGRASTSSSIGVSPSSLYFAPGQYAKSDLLKLAEGGLYINDISGLHAGTNAVSGDFSLLARGFEIKNGALGAPVKEITIAGNFIALLGKITHVGSEVYFDMPSLCRIGSPSLLVDFLPVSGKA
jgi:PmbA protein